MATTNVIADDHDIVHDGLSQMLSESQMEVVGHAYDGAQAVAMVSSLRPDLCIMDVRMPKIDGLDALDQIQEMNLDTAVILFSTFANPTYVARAVLRGAFDYLVKGASRAEILTVLSRASQKHDPPESSILVRYRRLMNRRKDKNAAGFKLTNREIQVLRHLGLGLTNQEIARSLSISIETVKEHVQNILRKTNASDRTQVAVWAVREALI
ncbi:MAG: response regulator transcription factor [Planctomycetota bacterium]|nr:response regulator transcription factor [Planctomycetota bacterium]